MGTEIDLFNQGIDFMKTGKNNSLVYFLPEITILSSLFNELQKIPNNKFIGLISTTNIRKNTWTGPICKNEKLISYHVEKLKKDELLPMKLGSFTVRLTENNFNLPHFTENDDNVSEFILEYLNKTETVNTRRKAWDLMKEKSWPVSCGKKFLLNP